MDMLVQFWPQLTPSPSPRLRHSRHSPALAFSPSAPFHTRSDSAFCSSCPRHRASSSAARYASESGHVQNTRHRAGPWDCVPHRIRSQSRMMTRIRRRIRRRLWGGGRCSRLLIFSDLASHCRPRPPSTERAGAMCGRHEVAEWALAEPQTDRGPFQFAFVSRAWNALGAPGLKPWS